MYNYLSRLLKENQNPRISPGDFFMKHCDSSRYPCEFGIDAARKEWRDRHFPSSYVKRFLYIILCIVFGAATAPFAAASFPARIQKIHIVMDTWVSAVHNEQYGNNGAEKRLKLKGQQEFALVDFDPLALRGGVIEKAVLHVRSSTPADAPIMRLGASTIASPWEEGHGRRYRKEVGSACFAQVFYKKSDWTYPGSTVLDAVFGKGHTRWRFSDCTPPDPDGWQVCAIQPEVLAARVAGISHGIGLFDEVGSEWSLKNDQFQYCTYPNRFFTAGRVGVVLGWKSGLQTPIENPLNPSIPSIYKQRACLAVRPFVFGIHPAIVAAEKRWDFMPHTRKTERHIPYPVTWFPWPACQGSRSACTFRILIWLRASE